MKVIGINASKIRSTVKKIKGWSMRIHKKDEINTPAASANSTIFPCNNMSSPMIILCYQSPDNLVKCFILFP